ncbi:YraN family protein [bacterium]|nr:YraN family protein [bacterium]
MNSDVGKKGEDIAVEYLKKQGYKILERNKHFSKNCEIDIIAKDKKTLVFIEVKTRTTTNFGHPFEAITKTKYNNIKTGVFTYLQEKKLNDTPFRIDAVSVLLKPEIKIEHLQNI